MLKIGLTGGIGCGKSTVTKVFSTKGITIIDADHIARDLVAPNTETLSEIIKTFGEILLQQDGFLNRSVLKQQVFSDANKLRQLEAILHPKIRQVIKNKLTEAESSPAESPYIIADIPLLFEKNYIDLFDKIVVVDCLPKQQIQRVRQRDEMSVIVIQSIMKKQISRDQRLQQATHILDNQATEKELLIQIDALHVSFLQF
jgi:dephospho-CoA kinase